MKTDEDIIKEYNKIRAKDIGKKRAEFEKDIPLSKDFEKNLIKFWNVAQAEVICS